jgi:cell division protein FtsX
LSPSPRVEINVFFGTDEDMARAADRLRTDEDVLKVATETKQQMFEWFRHAYADQPELVELTRPEAIPARVGVKPVRNVDHNALATRLREMFSPDGDVQDPCVDAPR